MKLEFGFQFGNLEPKRFRDLAQAADDLNFDLLLFPDHFVYEGPERQLDPHTLVFDSVVLAASALEATKKIRVGQLVLCNLFRHPAVTAQALMTLDNFSGGRVVAGLGTGWTETEFEMTGIPFPAIGERLKMLDEALTCIRSLWTNEKTTFSGQFYQFNDAIMWPKPVQKPHPPIILGGGGKGLLRIAAKHADYVNIIPGAGKRGHIAMADVQTLTDDEFSERMRFTRDEANRLGRDGAAIRGSNFVFIPMLTDSPEATKRTADMMAAGFGVSGDALLAQPMVLIGTAEEWVKEIRRRVDKWGVTQFIFSGSAGINEDVMSRIREQVISHL
jgi:probable F420-dependent oxidoreductase